MFVRPERVLPSFLPPLTHFIQQTLNANSSWPEKTSPLPEGVLMKGHIQAITSCRKVA